MKTIGIVGCGAIGKALIQAAEAGKLSVRIAGVTSRTEKNAREFLAAFKNPPPYLFLDELIRRCGLGSRSRRWRCRPGTGEKSFRGGQRFDGDQRRRAARSSRGHGRIAPHRLPSVCSFGSDRRVGWHQVRFGRSDHSCDPHHAQAAGGARRRALSWSSTGFLWPGCAKKKKYFPARRARPAAAFRPTSTLREQSAWPASAPIKRAYESWPCRDWREIATTSRSKASSAACTCTSKISQVRIRKPASSRRCRSSAPCKTPSIRYGSEIKRSRIENRE